MQKELAKGELAQAKVEELVKERAELRTSLEVARERAERVYFQKGIVRVALDLVDSLKVSPSGRFLFRRFILDDYRCFHRPFFSV